MDMHEADVLLSRQKKSIHHTRRISQENGQNARHLGVKSAAMTGFLDLQNPLHPGRHLMAGRPRGLIQIDGTQTEMRLEASLQGRRAVVGVCLAVSLQQDRPDPVRGKYSWMNGWIGWISISANG